MDTGKCWYKEFCTQECSLTCLRYILTKSLFELSKLPEAQWENKVLYHKEVGGDREAFKELTKIGDNIEDFVNNGENLYIWSYCCGNGKTSWAIKLMFKYFSKIWAESYFECKGLFINTQKFLQDTKRSINYEVDGYEKLCDNIEKAGLVIWDDLPCSCITDYEHQVLYKFLDGRISAGKANIITGNEDSEGFIEKLGDKLWSRLAKNSIELVEGDKRGWKYGTATDNK